ncbi:protamine P1 [Diplocarpon rosae]|nr:protamine P1 [Diplocarpon rosae]
MDRFNRSYDSEEIMDELYYCAPAFDLADVLCSGSDSEETPEQVAKKRARYEEAAQRVVAGNLPTLLSASLRGPFSKKSGWVNPWRQKPRRKREGEWWQPGSEDMLFTRTSVMKGAAERGLAHLDPEAALQWCKTTAQTEADATIETDLESGAVMISVERDELDESEDMPQKAPYSKDSDQVPHKLRHTDWENSSRYPDVSMLKYFTETPQTKEATGGSRRVIKRPADSEWLRGSYLSKRARWEGSAVPTPTPLLEELQKNGRWRQKCARIIGEPISTHSSELSTSILNISKDAPQLPLLTFQTPGQRAEYECDLGPRYTAGIVCKSSQNEKLGSRSQDKDNGELHDDTQRSWRSYHGSSSRVEKTLKRVGDHLFPNLEQDNLVAFTPWTKQTSVKSFGKLQSPNVQFSDPGSDDLPAIQRNSINYGDTGVVEYGDDDTFVTDVVPSSRNLEEFQFRRRARYIDPSKSEASVPLGDAENSTSISDGQQENLQKIISNSLRSDQVRFVDSESPTQRQSVSVNAPPVQRTPPESEKSSLSRDLLEVTHTSPFLRPAISPESELPPNPINSTVDTPLPTPKRTTPRQRPPMSNARLAMPPHESQEFQIVAKLAESSQNLYDMSTQSFNTTPPRSLPGPEQPHSHRPGAHSSDGEAERAVSGGGGYAADEMARIQMTLSQASPNSSFVGSLQRRQQLGTQGFKTVDGLTPQEEVLQLEAGKNISPIRRSPSLYQALHDKRIAEPRIFPDIERESMPSGEVAAQDRLILPNLISANATAKLATTAEHAQEVCVESYEPRSQVQVESEHLDVSAAGFEAKRIIASESGKTRSEAIWEACGPQSPWVIEDLGLRTITEQERAEVSEQDGKQGEGFSEDLIASDLPLKPLETEWEQVERPLTPYGSAMEPLKDTLTQTPSPDHGITDQANVSLNTQSFVEAAIKNPWMSAFRNKSSRKLKKRVSFGVTSGGQEAAQSHSSVRKISPATAPHYKDKDKGEVENEDGNEGTFKDGTAIIINAFGEHLAAATGPRVFKRILPEMRNSQLASSPALDAQAEAFIAADRELSSETEWPATSKSASSYHLQARSDANRNTVWDEPENSMFNNPCFLSPTANRGNINALTDFDMDEALGAASSFLDDTWNVDIELQKAKATDQTGHRRRKLFGLA